MSSILNWSSEFFFNKTVFYYQEVNFKQGNYHVASFILDTNLLMNYLFSMIQLKIKMLQISAVYNCLLQIHVVRVKLRKVVKTAKNYII